MKIFKIAVLLASLFTLVRCEIAPTQQRATSSVNSCEFSANMPPLFNMLENNQKQIIVELGDFRKAFPDASSQLKYKVYFRGSKENKEEVDQLILTGSTDKAMTRVTVPVTKTGVYYFLVFENEKKLYWKQKVFAIAPREHTLSPELRKELAEKYALVLSMHHDEQYFPVSIEYLTNQVEVDTELDREPFRLTNKKTRLFSRSEDFDFRFPFSQLVQILPYYGHSESVLKSGLESSAMTRLKS